MWGVIIGVAVGAVIPSLVYRGPDAADPQRPRQTGWLLIEIIVWVPAAVDILGWPAVWYVGLPRPWLVALVAAAGMLVLGCLTEYVDHHRRLAHLWPVRITVTCCVAYGAAAAVVGGGADLDAGANAVAVLFGAAAVVLVVSRLVERAVAARDASGHRVGEGS